jgi:type IV secretion system protein VirD4
VFLHGPAGDPDDPTDVPGEVVFAPKELKVAQDLSERLGYVTVPGRTRSRPSGLSSGRRSLSESDHRRALMLPQELLQMPPDRLIVLKAGTPPTRGRKIVYWRERAFTRRVRRPPMVVARPLPIAAAPASAPAASVDSHGGDPLTLAMVIPLLEDAGLEPPPPDGASAEAVEAWVERFIDASADLPILETRHGR